MFKRLSNFIIATSHGKCKVNFPTQVHPILHPTGHLLPLKSSLPKGSQISLLYRTYMPLKFLHINYLPPTHTNLGIYPSILLSFKDHSYAKISQDTKMLAIEIRILELNSR